jgi:hypothetical protein
MILFLLERNVTGCSPGDRDCHTAHAGSVSASNSFFQEFRVATAAGDTRSMTVVLS